MKSVKSVVLHLHSSRVCFASWNLLGQGESRRCNGDSRSLTSLTLLTKCELDKRALRTHTEHTLNGKRRHLSVGQLAAIAVNMLEPLKVEAKKRQLSNLKQGIDIPVPTVLQERNSGTGEAVAQAAELVNAQSTHRASKGRFSVRLHPLSDSRRFR